MTTDPDAHCPALLRLHREGCWAEVLVESQTLLEHCELLPWQRALIKQLEADALKGLGRHGEADASLEQSVTMAPTPLASLQWLESIWQQPLPPNQEWAEVSRHLVQAGHAEAVMSTVMGALARLPLECQRLRLIEAIEQTEALALEDQPQLQRQWSWLRRAAASGGSGWWS